MKRLLLAFALAGSFFVTAPVRAQSAEPEDGRYSFNRVEDGFLRLDNRTGQVSLCGRRAVGWACQAIPDERTALEGEIARLQNETAALKKELLSRGLALPFATKDNAEPPVAKRIEPELRLPNDADLARVKIFIEKVWRRLVEMMVNFQKDVLRKT